MVAETGEHKLAEICRYLGLKESTLDDTLAEQIRQAMAEIRAVIRPGTVWKVVPAGNLLDAYSAIRLAGEDIRAHLTGCKDAVLMAATLGADADRLIRQAQIGDMTRAVLLDACATAAIEQVCADLENEIRTELSGDGAFLTGRFSPGYGDLPISASRIICEQLDAARRIGLTVTDTFQLIPQKSVTAVLGVGNEESGRTRHSGCESCSMRDTCTYRR